MSKLNNTGTLFLFILLITLLLFSGHFGGDTIWNYLTAASFYTDGDFCLSNNDFNINIEGLESNFEGIYSEIDMLSQKGLDVYSIYGFVNVIAGIIFYGFGLILSRIFFFLPVDYMIAFIFSSQNLFFVSLLTIIFYKTCRLFSDNEKLNLYLALGFCFSNSIIIYALKSGFGEPLAATVLLAAFYYINLYKLKGKKSYLIISGFFTGSLMLTKIYLIIVIPGFFLFVLFLTGNRKYKDSFIRLLLYSAGFSIPLLIFLLYNYFRFGNVLDSGYSAVADSGSVSTEIVFNLYLGFIKFLKIVLSSGKSVFLFNPLAILGILGLKNVYKKNKSLFIFLISIILPYIIFFSFSSQWPSFGTWGTRYFIPLVSILTFPSVFLFNDIKENKYRLKVRILFTLMIIGIIIQMPAIFMNFSAFERFLKKECPHSFQARVSMPQYSQIFGGYFQMASGIKRILTGNSGYFPLIIEDFEEVEKIISSSDEKYKMIAHTEAVIVNKSLSGYDWFDLWWIHLARIKFASILIKLITTFIVLFLVFFSCLLGKKIFSDKSED